MDTAPGITFSFWRPLQLNGRSFEAKLSDSELTQQDIELVSWRALYRAKFSPPLWSGDMLYRTRLLEGSLYSMPIIAWGPENFVNFVSRLLAHL